MKKILLSCVTCLLAVGLLASCDETEVEETPNEPETSDTEKEEDSSTESGPVVVKTGKLGFLQANKGAYYYFTGELNGSGFGVCSTDFSEGADVIVSKEEDSYYLSIEVEKETLYLSCPDTEHSAMELSKDPYALVYNAEFDTFTTVDDTKFLGTYGTYETLCWANLYYNGVSNLGADGEFCASVFTEAQSLPAPTTLTVTGSNEVYVGNSITLTATVNDGADKSVTWSWEPAESSEGEVTVEGGKVTGVTAGEVVVTATSTVATNVSDSITITVLDVPAELPFEVGGEYWLGYTYNSSVYYFDGVIKSTYYGEVKTTSASAVFITVGEADDGYTLSFTDAEEKTQYIYLYGSGSYRDFGIRETPYTFTYDFSLETFVGPDEENVPCYIGNYYNAGTTYNELRAMAVSEYGTTEGNTYCIATLIEAAEPTTITIVGSETIMVGQSITLNAVVGEGEDYRVAWSITSGEGYGSIDASSGVLTAGSNNVGQTITVVATSLKHEDVSSNEFTITIAEYKEESSITITPESLAAEYSLTIPESGQGSAGDVSGNTSTYGDGALTVYWGKSSGTGICPWASVSATGYKTTIRIYNSAYFTVADGSATVSRVVISAAYSDARNGCGTSFSADGGTVGTAVTITGGDQVEVTPTSTSLKISRSDNVCYCTEITIYYFA